MSPHFLPYIGSDYTLGIHGKRVMVLGESHYISAPEEDTPDMTQSVIEWYLNEQKSPETQGWFATYTKFISLVGRWRDSAGFQCSVVEACVVLQFCAGASVGCP
jgi:hypothetical protein